MSAHVGILFSEEMFDWRDCVMKSIRENSKEMITFSTCTDDEYTDMRKRTVMKSEWSGAAVLIIMVSPGFLQRLLKSNAIHFPTFPLKTKVYFFFCGVEIDCLEKNELKSRFHNYNSIQKHDHTKVVELVESVVQVLFHSDLNHPDYSRDPSTLQQSFRRSDLKKFDLIPKVVLLENKARTMIVTFDEDVNLNSDVSFELEGVCDKKTLKHERLAPNIFRISLIKEIFPGQGKISLLLNNKRMASQSFTIHSMATQTRLFNILDSALSLAGKQSINLGELDKIISSELSNESIRKPEVLEKYEKIPEIDLQTLAQLASKHNLKESCAVLSKLDRKKLQRRTTHESVVRNISPASKAAPKHKEASTIPEHQRELIEILNKVKLGEITVDNAEDLFKYWNFKHGDSIERSQSRLNLADKGKKISVPILPKVDNAIVDREACNLKIISSLEKHLSTSPFRKLSLPEDKKEGPLCRQSIPNFYSGMNQHPAIPKKSRESKDSTPPTYANSTPVGAIICPTIQESPVPTYLAMDGNWVTEPCYEVDIPIAAPKVYADDDTYDLNICQNYANVPNQHSLGLPQKPPPVIKKKPIPIARTKISN